jgi:hypothetical protein
MLCGWQSRSAGRSVPALAKAGQGDGRVYLLFVVAEEGCCAHHVAP